MDHIDSYSSTVSSAPYEITAEYMAKQLKRLQNPKNKVEIINPQIIMGISPPIPSASKDDDQKKLTVDEYHENLLSDLKDKKDEDAKEESKSPIKGKLIEADDVYNYLSQSIN